MALILAFFHVFVFSVAEKASAIGFDKAFKVKEIGRPLNWISSTVKIPQEKFSSVSSPFQLMVLIDASMVSPFFGYHSFSHNPCLSANSTLNSSDSPEAQSL